MLLVLPVRKDVLEPTRNHADVVHGDREGADTHRPLSKQRSGIRPVLGQDEFTRLAQDCGCLSPSISVSRVGDSLEV